MANNDMNLENEESAGKFERFLFLMIPIIFTLVLLGVLLTLFNIDFRNNALTVANKIPFVEKWIPDPPVDPALEEEEKEEEQEASSEVTIKELKAQLTQQGESLKKVTEEKETEVQALQSQIDALLEEASAVLEVDEVSEADAYEKQVTDLAKLYAGMKASKAALIMENLTPEEMVQIFSVMNNASKIAILEKMTPKTAADVSVKLKENTTSTDLAIAALQSRLKKEAATPAASTNSANLDKEELSQTFTSMPAASAAKLLGEMFVISPDKVVTILNTVSDNVRSSILGEMTKINSVQTAKIVNRLMGAK